MLKTKRFFDPSVDDLNWGLLFNKHLRDLKALNAISSTWNAGFSKLGINNSKLPSAEALNKAIAPYTRYTFVQTDNHLILEQREWYAMIADYKMPLTCFLRTPEELEYCDEPDIWHDIMGHIPFLAQEDYSEMYQLLASTYIKAFDEQRGELIRALDFIGGMIIELGLIREPSGLKAFGSTFYSSSEVFEAFKPENQIELTLEALNSGESYDRHSFQGRYYIFQSLEQLVEIINNIRKKL